MALAVPLGPQLTQSFTDAVFARFTRPRHPRVPCAACRGLWAVGRGPWAACLPSVSRAASEGTNHPSGSRPPAAPALFIWVLPGRLLLQGTTFASHGPVCLLGAGIPAQEGTSGTRHADEALS